MKKMLLASSLFAVITLGAGCSEPAPAPVATSNGLAYNASAESQDQLAPATPAPAPAAPPTTEPTPAPVTTPAAPPELTLQQKLSLKKPSMEIDKNKSYTAVLHTTAGDITISLNAKSTPITVNNFVTLARKTFYNGVIFHRTIPGFMIQGGDPTGTGSGGPGYRFDDEPFTGEYTRGTIAMANAGPNTNGSQFFIMHADYDLPKNYVIFGHVTSGLEAVDKIATAPTKPGGEGSSPVAPATIKSVDIIEK